MNRKNFNRSELAFLQQLFNLPEDDISNYPGISAYLLHLEKSFTRFLGPTYNEVWKGFGFQNPENTEAWWSRITTVLAEIQKASRNDSIETIWENYERSNDLQNIMIHPLSLKSAGTS